MGKKKNNRKGAFYSDDEDGKENPRAGRRSNEENKALEKQKQSKSRSKAALQGEDMDFYTYWKKTCLVAVKKERLEKSWTSN